MSLSSRLCAGLFGSLFVVAAACGGEVDDDADDDGGDDDAATSSSSSSSGAGPDAGKDSASPAGDAASTSCAVDLDCNGDPEVSAMQGSCQLGICVCNGSFVVQPSGKCGKTAAPPCTVQGGACRQDPAECPAGTLESESGTNMSCGDLVAAVCCFDEAACKGPTFTCLAPTDAQRDPICVNGWRTCAAGMSAVQLSR